MFISKADFLSRRAELVQKRQDAFSTLSAIDGALQDINFWLALYEQREKEQASTINVEDVEYTPWIPVEEKETTQEIFPPPTSKIADDDIPF